MRRLTPILMALACAVAVWPALCPADTPTANPLSWKNITIDKIFRSEGSTAADVNKDGLMDVIVGDYWYEAPNWTMHQIREVRPGRRLKEIKTNEEGKAKGFYGDGLRNYSECMACWADDINGDGYPDLVLVGFPGDPCYWYENPKGKPGLWIEHEIWHSACNETPKYVDLFGTGKRVLLMGWQPKGKKADGNEGQMSWFAPGADPTQLWVQHPISEPSAQGKAIPGTMRFSHGLGAGDLNGDGRADVICTGGWWEQPADGAKATGPWTFHPAKLGDACADMYAIDMDGDRKADVVASSAHKFGIWAYLQRSAASHPDFLKTDLYPELVSETHAMHYVDLDGDGIKDLVTGKRKWSHGRSEPGSDAKPQVYLLKGSKSSDGTTKFTPHLIDEDSGIGTQFEIVDFNGDGKLDIVTSNKHGVHVLLQVPRGPAKVGVNTGSDK
ncbi:MAG: VCBS repeat-containing protein [Gemmataceae bacterium]